MSKVKYDKIGVDVGSSHVSAVRLVRKGGKLMPVAVVEAGLPRGTLAADGQLQHPEHLTSALQMVRKHARLRSRTAHMAIPTGGVFLQTMVRKRMSAADLAESIKLDVEPGLPYRGDAVVSYDTLGITEEKRVEVLVVACPAESPRRLTQAAYDAGLKVADVFCEATVLPAAIDAGNGEHSDLLLHIGALSTTAVIVHRGKVRFASSMPIGGQHFTDALVECGYAPAEAEQFKRRHSLVAPDVDDPHAAEHAAMQTVANHLSESVYQLLTYEASETNEPPARILLSGGGALLHGIEAHFNMMLDMPVQRAEPHPDLEGVDPDLFCRQALAYSLAMTAREDIS